jgi:hypothetical protein
MPEIFVCPLAEPWDLLASGRNFVSDISFHRRAIGYRTRSSLLYQHLGFVATVTLIEEIIEPLFQAIEKLLQPGMAAPKGEPLHQGLYQ